MEEVEGGGWTHWERDAQKAVDSSRFTMHCFWCITKLCLEYFPPQISHTTVEGGGMGQKKVPGYVPLLMLM